MKIFIKLLYFSLLVLATILNFSCTECTYGSHPYASNTPMPKPKLFEIPYVKSAWHITFTPEGKTFYFVSHSNEIEVIKFSNYEKGKWCKPQQAEFSGKYRMETPHISRDGSKFFFAKTMVKDDRYIDDIYIMNKTALGWTYPVVLDSPVNSSNFEAYPSCSENGNLYFLSDRAGKLEIYCSKFINGKYTNPEQLDETLSFYNALEPLIAPDESYILFNCQLENTWRLCISFRKNGGRWSEPKDLGSKINFSDYQGHPCISPDGNYLFYTSVNKKDWVMSQYQVDWKPLLDSLKILSETL